MNYYEKKIHEHTNCKPNEVSVIEDIMRNDILHSTLDWLSESQFRLAAREAHQLLKQERVLYEQHYPQLKMEQK